jgi:glycosyltransferase involved in cell wall biosynthesis
MKIAFVTPEFPHEKMGSSGGIGTSILNLAKGLIANGNTVHVFVYGQKIDEEFEFNSIKIHRIKNIKIKGLSWLLTQKKVQSILNSYIKKNEIDIVEFPDWTGFSSSINLNCPIVIRLNGSDSYFCHLDKRNVKKVNFLREKKALIKADALISVSQYTADITNEIFKLNKNFKIIPNSIDTSKFIPSNEDDSNQNTILYFGTLIRKKGLLELANIFNEVNKIDNQIKLILIGKDASDIASGSSSTWEIMKGIFTSSALENVDYKGSVQYDEINKHIQMATLCVFPSFAEALPVSWIEAMALKKAIVASNIGWASEIIDDSKDGFLVNPKNHKLYAEKILELISNSNLRKDFGEKARIKVEKVFSIDTIAKQSVDYYKKVLELKK